MLRAPGHVRRLPKEAQRQAGPASPVRSGSAAWSSRRELMPSLVNTLRRCHSTVRGLMNSSAPISELL